MFSWTLTTIITRGSKSEYGRPDSSHDVAPRRFVQPIFDRAYALDSEKRVHPQQLGLLFIILAMGALFNPALPPHDPSAEHHLAAARWCLVRGDFIGNNTIAGLQCVVIMAHYHLETEKGRNGDSAWPLWGVAMRLVTAMGMHIDGKRWNLPDEVAEERRLVFWETQTIDVFQVSLAKHPADFRPIAFLGLMRYDRNTSTQPFRQTTGRRNPSALSNSKWDGYQELS